MLSETLLISLIIHSIAWIIIMIKLLQSFILNEKTKDDIVMWICFLAYDTFILQISYRSLNIINILNL